MPYQPEPVAFSKGFSIKISADPAYPSGGTVTQVVPINDTTNKWTFVAQQIHDQQLDQLATAFEKLFFQDFSQPQEFDGIDIDPVTDPLGGPDLAAGFRLQLVQVADLPGSWIVGNSACSLSLGWALRRGIRVTLGRGTAYVPPALP